eukprot:CAMPEP_0172650092 /NCGR_PEP_ID=MMETSP1068-20121228/242120_1 /TAXON_ID=35684 /ORGANISM="Pseudopedinella elastica, Strain CCMP716" /LENGTH=188 /DNA_ID=CAMNT_0013464455 /DNA_START=762 /DNA_END=1328 /DNA_ORIENTATION=-
MAGMALVQLGPTVASVGAASASTSAPATSALGGLLTSSALIGSAAVLASSLVSGLANILFEKLVKTKSGSLYARQIQLAFWTSCFTAVEIVRRAGFAGLWPGNIVEGWTAGVWAIVGLKSLGGLLVASTVMYTNNIVKTFATAMAIVLTTLVTWSDAAAKGPNFFAGCGLVLASIYLYARGGNSTKKS